MLMLMTVYLVATLLGRRHTMALSCTVQVIRALLLRLGSECNTGECNHTQKVSARLAAFRIAGSRDIKLLYCSIHIAS